ncbi:MAG: endonuclease [Oceanospirillaceae bacterium]|nr:endonuclease [Oceanospirillaceae bacterium]HCI02833.1 endonuclease/exonuclease/phosphatase family protein [Oceanospirillaceae bacterium]
MRIIKIISASLLLIIVALTILVWAITFHPPPLQNEKVYNHPDAPMLQGGQNLKVLSWNVQYMASKNYEFWYDRIDGSGPDVRPSREDIEATYQEVVRVIEAQNPDIILLQELHDGAVRTDYEDQLQRLLGMLPKDYANYTEAFYWQADFVPLPQIMGSVGMKLAVISKYRIDTALRHQLATIKTFPLYDEFNFKRAIQEVQIPVYGGQPLTLMNTHFDAFAQGSDTMQQQVAYLQELLSQKDQAEPWLIAGDFNLLPPGQYKLLPEADRNYYQANSELASIYDGFKVVPSIEQATGENARQWFTHFPNRKEAVAPDRTIDFFVHADNLDDLQGQVLQENTWHISDHLPMVAKFTVPE